MCNDDNYSELVAWANDIGKSSGGFPVENIISNGRRSGEAGNMVQDVDAFLRRGGDAESHLMVVDTEYCFEPSLNLNRLVEHSMVRGKDTVTFLDAPPRSGLDTAGCWGLEMDDTTGANPKVTSVAPPASASGAPAVLAPLYFFRKTTLPDVSVAADAGLPSLEAFTSWLVSSGRPVYGLPIEMFFSVKTAAAYELADAFFGYVARETGKPPSAQMNATKLLTLTQTLRSPGGAAATLSATAVRFGSTPLGDLLERFTIIYQQSRGVRLNSEGPGQALPERFSSRSVWDMKTTKQHPVYETSNHVYGSKAPRAVDMPDAFFGIRGEFATSPYCPPVPASMRTGVTRSNVHKAFDSTF